jgi:hypothetical protein
MIQAARGFHPGKTPTRVVRISNYTQVSQPFISMVAVLASPIAPYFFPSHTLPRSPASSNLSERIKIKRTKQIGVVYFSSITNGLLVIRTNSKYKLKPEEGTIKMYGSEVGFV